jgi:NAD(P)-dependent dehydrogenase (short-subunit alcohol dehydrogenase family)
LSALTAPAEIKALLFDRLSRSGRTPSPGELERAYQMVIRAREIRRNLELFRAAGSHVEYAQADVRDSSSMAKIIADWRERFGDPVGLIHGAGLIKDKLIRDKSAETFDRVLGTKLDGALNLVGLLNPAKLKFTVLFSSIAGRFGNRGQSDYSAANEVLNKLAIWIDRRWPGRVVPLIWGPWSGVGMVSDLEAHLDSQGLGMIAPEVGVAALMDELTLGRKGDVEVIVSGHLGTLDGPVGRAADPVESAR